MSDYYLKAATEEELYAALTTAVVIDEERNPISIALDIIGTIYKQTGTDGQGMPIMTAQPGYHANIRGALTADQQSKRHANYQTQNEVTSIIAVFSKIVIITCVIIRVTIIGIQDFSSPYYFK